MYQQATFPKDQGDKVVNKCVDCNCIIAANNPIEKCSCCHTILCENCVYREGTKSLDEKQVTCKNCCGTERKHEEKSGLEMKEKEHSTGHATTGHAKGTIETK